MASAAQRPSSQKVWTSPDKSERVAGTLKRFPKNNSRQEKPKTASAGGGANPPKNPPKGPSGPKDPNKGGKGDDYFGKKSSRTTSGDTTKTSGLTKSNSQFNDRRNK